MEARGGVLPGALPPRFRLMIDYAQMNQLLFEGKHEPVKQLTEAALAEGRPAMEVLEDGLIAGMRVVGEDFRHNRIFVPEVLLAARAMKAGTERESPALRLAANPTSKRATLFSKSRNWATGSGGCWTHARFSARSARAR